MRKILKTFVPISSKNSATGDMQSDIHYILVHVTRYIVPNPCGQKYVAVRNLWHNVRDQKFKKLLVTCRIKQMGLWIQYHEKYLFIGRHKPTVGSQLPYKVQFFKYLAFIINHFRQTRGWILGWNPDKSLQRFPPCYSLSPLELCLIFLFLQTHATSFSVKEKGGKPDRNPN